MADYKWKMIGDPFLDGVIFGKGAKKSSKTINITVTYLPDHVIYQIIELLENKNLLVDIIEEKNYYTRQKEIKLKVRSLYKIFSILPSLSEREMHDEENTEFIKGYLFSNAYPTPEGIKFSNFKRNQVLVKDLLRKIGIKKFIVSLKTLLLPVDQLSIKEFKDIYDGYLIDTEMTNEEAIDTFYDIKETGSYNYYYKTLVKNTYEIYLELQNNLDKRFPPNIENETIKDDLRILHVKDATINDIYQLFNIYERRMKVLFIISKEYSDIMVFIKKFTDIFQGKKVIMKDSYYYLGIDEDNMDLINIYLNITENKSYDNITLHTIPKVQSKEIYRDMLVNNWEHIYNINHDLTIEWSNEIIDNGGYRPLLFCQSCGNHLNYFSGFECSNCKISLCTVCYREYKKDNEPYCMKHFPNYSKTPDIF